MAGSVGGAYNPLQMFLCTNNKDTNSNGKVLVTHVYSLGFWIGLFNTLGALGFLLCPLLYLPGYLCSEDDTCEYFCDAQEQCDTYFDDLNTWGGGFSTLLGSCFFWIAGVLECIEFADNRKLPCCSCQK